MVIDKINSGVVIAFFALKIRKLTANICTLEQPAAAL